MVLLLFVKCSCTNKVFFTEKCDLLSFGGTSVHFFFVLPFFLKCNIKNAPLLNATSAYKYEEIIFIGLLM